VRISTRGEYGVRAMFHLTVHYGKGPIPVRTIALEQGIPEYYLEQLIGDLRRAGLVTSVRGAQGGYSLARPPEEITVGDILRVLEGPITPMECLDRANTEPDCGVLGPCAMRRMWKRLQDSMERVLDTTTLASLVQESLLCEEEHV
jgi:Rrf2 family cysteine metabolism transcriptional repressor